MNAPTPSGDDKAIVGICYLGNILCMIPTVIIFLMKKDQSQHIKFHSLQAMGYGLAWAVVGFTCMILGVIPVLGQIIGFVATAAMFVGWLVLTIQAFQGKDINLPVLGDFIRANLMK